MNPPLTVLRPWTTRPQSNVNDEHGIHEVFDNVGQSVATGCTYDEAYAMVGAVNAIPALRDALTQWPCASCGGSGTYLNRRRVARSAEVASSRVPCKVCEGQGLHPLAIAALKLCEGL